MPESASSDTETLTRLKKASRDVVDYLTTLGKVDLASLSKEAEDTRVKLLQELIEILSGSPDGLLNGGEANGEPVPEVVPDDFAEDYEVPTSTLQRNAQLVEPDRESTASIEKKESKSAIVHSKSNTDMKKKKGLTRMKSSQVVELPDKDKRKKEGNLIEKKLMRRTVQHWAVLSADTLYLAKNSEERHSELKIRLKDASVSEQKNLREFLIKRQGKSYVLRAESDEECHLWIDQIQQCIDDINGLECEFSDEEDYVPPVSPTVDTTEDKTSVEPEEVYENEDETPKVGDENEMDGDNDDVYDDVEAPTVTTPAALLAEPDRSESVSSATSNTSTAKRISIFGGSGKSKDGMPSEGKLSGFVQKKGKFSWDKKWFVLCDHTLYYANGDTDKKCQGMLSLVGASIDTKSSDSRPYAINIKYKNNKMQLAWDDSLVYDDWVKAIKSAAGDDQSSDPSPSEKDLKVEEDGEGEDVEAEEPQEDYVNPDLNADAEGDGDEVYDDVVAEPQKSDDTPTPVSQKQPAIKKPIRGGGKSELKDPDHSGYLHRKTTGIIKKWERKWFFIVDKTLYMSATEEEESYKSLLPLANVSEVVKGSLEKQYPYGITLQLKPSCGRDVILAVDSKEDQSLWVAKFNEACDVFSCELSSDEEDGAYLNKAPPPAPEPQKAQEEETTKFDDQGFIMEDIYEDVSQPLEDPPEPPPPKPKEPAKNDPSAPSLPPRNPNLKPTAPVPSVPSLPPRNQPATPSRPSPAPEPEPIMEEFYEDMDEVQRQYENAKSIAEQKNAAAVEEPPVTKKDLPVPKADTEKKSPLLKKKELKKEKEQQKKEQKKKEKENKKQKKEKEKSKTIGSKAKGKSADLKPDDTGARSQSFSAPSTSKPAEDEEEYVIEELTAEDEMPKVDAPEPIDDEIYEDVEEPPPPSPQTKIPSTSIKKPPPPAASGSTKSSVPRVGVTSPPGTVSDFKKSSSPISEPPRSQSVSPSGVKIRTGGITVSSISKPKPPSSVTPNGTTTSTETTANSETTSTTSSTTTSSSLKTTVSKPVTSSPALNRPRVKVSEAIYKFQKRSSTIDAVLHSGKLFHKAPGRTRFRQEYCEISGTVMSFYREKGDERAFGTLNLDECELRMVQEQYEGRRYVFCLAAGSALDMLSPELQADLDKWLSVLEPLVKKYVKEE